MVGKQNLYEHTWRVPFIVRGPGIKAGSRAAGNLYLMDVLPTMCEMAGIVQAECIDGTSLRPVLLGEEENPNEYLLQHHDSAVQAHRGVKPGPGQLNLADDPAYAAKRMEMEALLLGEMEKWGDPYRLWDQE